MSEFENGYYWVSYKGMKPVIMEKDNYGWNAMGIETEPDLTDYKVLGKVSEWDLSVPQANELSPHVSGSAFPKYDCDDCKHYPCQTEPDSHGSRQRKIEYGKCGDHSERCD